MLVAGAAMAANADAHALLASSSAVERGSGTCRAGESGWGKNGYLMTLRFSQSGRCVVLHAVWKVANNALRHSLSSAGAPASRSKGATVV